MYVYTEINLNYSNLPCAFLSACMNACKIYYTSETAFELQEEINKFYIDHK